LDVYSWRGYLEAHRIRRAAFAALGTTATDHGHPTAATADLSDSEAQVLFGKIISGSFTPAEAELFRAQMLTEMAKLSIDDGLVMQIHPGAFRNHNRTLFESHGRDKGADIPQPTDYVHALKPLLDRFGNHPRLTVIVFTLDESTYSRELAPLAGIYPVLKLGPAWWFHDSSRRPAALPRADDGDRRLLQHGGFQRRYPCVSVDSGAPRRGATDRLRLSGSPRRRTPSRSERRGRGDRHRSRLQATEAGLSALNVL
jgi:hypothetical protein